MTDPAHLSHGSGAGGAEEVLPAESGRHQGQNEGKEKQASRQRFSCQPRPVKTQEQTHRCDYKTIWLCFASSGQCICILVTLVVPFDVTLFLCLYLLVCL